MLIHLVTLLSLVVSIVQGQLVSPCPDVLKYEPRSTDQPDRWFGVVTLGTDEDLEGVWLKIMLDRKVDLLGNWFAEAISKDNMAFSIRNPQYKLAAGPPILVRFFVKYNAAGVVPTVKKILLNGKTICPTSQSDPTEPTLHISVGKPSSGESPGNTNENQNENPSSGTRTSTRRPQGTTTQRAIDRPLNNIAFMPDDSIANGDDFFQGDFHIVSNQRTTSRPLVAPTGPVQCGTVAQLPTPLISFGHGTTPGQWPWHIALYLSQATELKYTCGGTLISDSHVVTAAHCVTKPRTTIPVRKDKLVIYLGKYNLISFGGEVQDRQVESIIVHPQYNSSVYFNDIAVLKMDSPAQINNFVRPCCLWEDRETNIEHIIGQKGTVVGWGYNENGQLSKTLLQAQLPVVSTTTCLFSNRNFFSQFISDKNFCAGYKNDTSVCNGDSGGGMVFSKRGPSGQAAWQLRGIISLGVARQNEAVCDPSQYSILTDAAKYVHWIKESIKN